MVGSTLSHYQIVEKIGEGGMGVVYKAWDTRLERAVAVKVLQAERMADDDRKRRFVQEAKTASALNHPNIITIHDIGHIDGVDFIAMELVDGQTLEELIPPKGMRLSFALECGVQIADALATAHVASIVHRDLKPGNVMVTPRGQVKVLDFGLAKLTEPISTPVGENQETLTIHIESTPRTEHGAVLGTVAYMSPEQVEGYKVDERSDVFSFGSLLYEMVTGQRAFQGNSRASTMAAVVEHDPQPVRRLVPRVPADLETTIDRCLRKDVNRRMQHMDDVRVALADAKEAWDSGPSSRVSAVRRPRLNWATAWIAAALLAGLLLGLVIGRKPGTPLAADAVLSPITSDEALAGSPSWSPDGQWLVYASNREGTMDLWKRPAEGGAAERLTVEPDNEGFPSWSPDGRIIAFSSDADGGGIFVIPAGGGTPAQIASFGAHPVWSPDGRSLAFDWRGDIYTVAAAGGDPVRLLAGTSSRPYMTWSPSGRRLVFWNRTKGDVFVVDVTGGEAVALDLVPAGEEVSGLSWSRDGKWLVYSRGPFGGNKNLWRVSVSAGGFPTGDPQRLTLSASDDGDCHLSPDGKTVAYVVRHFERHLWRVPLDASTGLTAGRARQITGNSRLNYYPTVSPDGRTVVWTSQASGQGHLYVIRLGAKGERKVTPEWGRFVREVGASFSPDSKQLCYSSTLGGSYQLWRLPSIGSIGLQVTETQQPTKDSQTAWSPDGETIAFYSNRSGSFDIWVVNASGNAQPRQLTEWDSNEIYPTYSPDGKLLAFVSDRNGNPDIWVRETPSGELRPLIEHPAEEGPATWSPDGRWFYFTSNRTGQFEIFVTPSGGGEAKQVELGNGGTLPDTALFAKFAVTSQELIVPLERRRGEIYLLENLQ